MVKAGSEGHPLDADAVEGLLAAGNRHPLLDSWYLGQQRDYIYIVSENIDWTFKWKFLTGLKKSFLFLEKAIT